MPDAAWEQIEPGWYWRKDIGSVCGPKSHRSKGWYFMPAWKADLGKYGIGPFRTMRAAIAEAERLAGLRRQGWGK